MEIQEVIRRWQAGGSQRQIGVGTGLSRVTVRKYLAAAMAAGLEQDGPAPDEVQLSQLAGVSRAGPRRVETPVEDRLIPWGDQIYRWLSGDRLQVTRIRKWLLGRGCQVSYKSLRRFVQKRNWRRLNKVNVRMEDTPPCEVVEVDFGRLGLVHDPETGRRRAVWALIVIIQEQLAKSSGSSVHTGSCGVDHGRTSEVRHGDGVPVRSPKKCRKLSAADSLGPARAR